MLPYIEVKGTAQAMGLAIGEHLREDIEVALTRFEKHLISTPASTKTRVAQLWKVAKKFFPEHVAELEGIANGSKQPLQRLIQFSFEEELAYTDHCSTLAIHTGRTIFLGHNEDWEHAMPLYVVKAKPKKGPEFLSLSYTGQLPGTSVGINEAGIAFGNNSIATKIHFSGLPKIYCLRGFLSACSIDGIADNLSRHHRASGNSSTIVSGGQLFILEWSPNKMSVETCRPWLAHANRYVTHNVQSEQLAAHRASTSKQRQERMWQMLLEKEVRSADDVKKILSDHSNRPKCLCCHGTKDRTIASAVVDVGRGELQVAYGQPCETPFRKYTL